MTHLSTLNKRDPLRPLQSLLGRTLDRLNTEQSRLTTVVANQSDLFDYVSDLRDFMDSLITEINYLRSSISNIADILRDLDGVTPEQTTTLGSIISHHVSPLDGPPIAVEPADPGDPLEPL